MNEGGIYLGELAPRFAISGITNANQQAGACELRVGHDAGPLGNKSGHCVGELFNCQETILTALSPERQCPLFG